MKKQIKKLNLNRVTVSNLDIMNVNGGLEMISSDLLVRSQICSNTKGLNCYSFTGSYVACASWAC